MEPLRSQGDPLADALIPILIDSPEWAIKINSWSVFPNNNDIAGFPKELIRFIEFYSEAPDFIEKDKVKISQDFFNKEGNMYLAMLGFYSLPFCYAFGDGAQVLIRSKRITDEVGLRLSETALFLLDAYRPGTFLSDDQALITFAKVRLIHAYSRYFVKKYAIDWNNEWGIPINQEDMIGTNSAFSLMVIRGMEKMGRFPGKVTLEAVLHYWKIIGYYMGINISYWPDTSKESFELEKIIRKRQLKESEAGKVLIGSLIKYYKNSIPDKNLTSYIETIIAYFIGKEASSALGINEEFQLPKALYGLMLDLSFYRQSGKNPSYKKIRSLFIAKSKIDFGKEVQLHIPVIKRS
ncbi:DUF2236 domain-containing protein [Belliella sp. R4-6]|uniref:DUF2236 domain-containing protein n=1 Tax=Belliella alkalica TaxID=1730871 RepID=A0ABS9V706_9BACT|nr:oxygenase MpaB family protein [Belliella alkalica]MCH7412201.1 DUF2236 domain-containing protein [Belliella alkalica]